MKIGIDIDETLIKTEESFNNVIKKYNINFNSKYHEKWDEEQAKWLFNNYGEEIFSNASLKENVKESLNYLHKQGHELIIITARSFKFVPRVDLVTNNMIKENNLPISDIF